MEDLKKLVKDKKAFVGTDQTIKNLKLGKVSKVLLSSNCPSDVKGDIKHYAALSNAKIEELDVPSDELGIICKKQFKISVMGVKKE
ncbi:50S ribosomal protein L30 [Candidatus Woesearchaeota archaeon CG10_big_fil_rev_8_21_14_0_10_44_13]|nr:MAG: 50S ribosomal protein L30 [Candidatus Woesearchaeota archaeon CG10_big_fil_rev_8_21_14_0_10_44_13]